MSAIAPAPADGTPLRIGELSARSGRSVHTIRWYEGQGLMPGVGRDGGGRRVYTPRHVDWLDLMDRLRRTGMTIADMRAYTALVRQGRATLAQRRDLLRAHRERVLARIDEWHEALRLVDGKIDYYGEWLATGQRPARKVTAAAPRGRGGAGARQRLRRTTRPA